MTTIHYAPCGTSETFGTVVIRWEGCCTGSVRVNPVHNPNFYQAVHAPACIDPADWQDAIWDAGNDGAAGHSGFINL